MKTRYLIGKLVSSEGRFPLRVMALRPSWVAWE